ncbi:anti-sigma factor family protein [Mycobacterium vicinigordonae]|uniref:Zf-HC2 domain-containing protein n=1 Tax=Mycobacterium vicinigordonae TaxID=1719132 RepID=A0A7D6INN5_9MYCO|nr:zf-HC2 domain-containing protein [Mycobacterium vicinigordonae]QLL08380.1 zf-HC2 domain-containing protein [Mycobacterium vicinigordonae]
MTEPGRGHAPPDDHPFAMWDAAYVLGSLSPADRLEFEAHLPDCTRCRDSVAELSGVPALLGRLRRDEVAAIDDAASTARDLPAALLPSLLATVRRRRRRTRVLTWAASAAAAVVLGVGVLIGGHGFVGGFGHHSATTASTQTMQQVGTKLLTSTISLSSHNWGTFINLECYCLAPPDAKHDTLAMVVVGRDGSQTRLATWVAEPGHTASPAGSVSTPLDQIASVRVVSADTGQVLLERAF